MKPPATFGFLVVCLLLPYVQSYKILSLFPQCSKSHLTGYLPLATELASRGHDVTVIHPFENLEISKQIKSIVVPEMLSAMDEIKRDVMNKSSQSLSNPFTFILGMREFVQNSCRKSLSLEPIQKLLKQGKQYDVVIVNSLMNECSLAIAPLLGNYVILHSSGPLPPMLPHPAPRPPSVVPHTLLGYPSKMNFQQRFVNFLLTAASDVIYNYYVIPSTTSVLQEMVPEAPPLKESWKQISMYFENLDVITSSPRASVPNLVSLPGQACRPAKPLPKELEAFMQSSGEDGVIIFGLGSFAESQHLPPETINAFLKGFSQLKQKVIWKFEDQSLVTPQNVKIMSWMPQQDLLGHPKTKLFISHGGMSSMQEAVYHNVPVIGIPVFADQPGNVQRLKELGVAESLTLETVTHDNVYETVTKILTDKSYYEQMTRYSAIFKDVIQPPVKKGAFWVEYVVRHNGARHLRTLGEDMCFIQYFLIDVIAFLTITPLVSLWIFYRIIKYAWRKIKSCKQKQKASKKKTQ